LIIKAKWQVYQYGFPGSLMAQNAGLKCAKTEFPKKIIILVLTCSR
jgi:hypothetical protein